MTMQPMLESPALDARWAESFTITGRGDVVVAASTVDGPRLHLAGPGTSPEPVETLVSTDQLLPVARGDRIAFWARLSDAGLVLVVADLAADTLTELPVRAPLQPHTVAWSSPDELITSERTAEGTALIRVAADGSAPPEVLWRTSGPARWIDPVPDVGPDGRIVLTVATDASQDLLVLDPADGTVSTLVAGNRSAAPTQGRWSPDGRRVLITVRRRRSTQTLLADLDAGVLESLDLPSPLALPVFDESGSRLAFASAAWPWTRLLVYGIADGRITAAPLADGECGERPLWYGDVCFFVAFGPDLPPEVRRWRPGDEETVTVAPSASLPKRTTPTVLRIPTSEGFDLPALVHEPAGPVRGTVVELHGGPSMHWRVAWNPILLTMVAAGYRVVLVETRGTTFNAWPIPPMPVTEHGVQEVVDVGYCLEELVRRGLAEPGRIVLAGHSHGAYVAYRASQTDQPVAGVIMTSGYLQPGTLADSADPEVHRFAATAYASAAADGVLPARCPVLAVHGERDRQVPADAAAATFARLAGTGHRWVLLPGEEHGFRQRRSAIAYAAEAVAFLDRVTEGV
ncbi:S9 family peptidase [Cryptosporangium sp. NPDC051539]|uniref:S9 family peptidase n=1 Tax=Cryptosporangium sp. NPDC051539 TaxID=3363962 RepID=UPI0037906A03